MLNIWFGNMPDVIYDTSTYFKHTYRDQWITDPLSKEMIRDVDQSTVIGPRVIDSPVLGGISPKELSGGVKTLIAIYKRPDKVFNASACGDNCAKYLLQLAENRDIKVTLHHAMDFGTDFSVKVINDGKRRVITDAMELLLLAHHYLRV